jgi:NAD(P)-dependent dehydrogenase (short-subunit alcohol dehydrogenase family)
MGGEPNQRGISVLQKSMATSPRVGQPEEIANLAVFLASDEASLLNGAIIPANAGWLAF